MKKEIIAGVFLLVILVACLINIYFISELTDEMIQLIEDAEKLASAESWETAAARIETALKLWTDKDGYTAVVLSHDDIDEATEALYELLSKINAQSIDDITGAAQIAITCFEHIATDEQISFSSVF